MDTFDVVMITLVLGGPFLLMGVGFVWLYKTKRRGLERPYCLSMLDLNRLRGTIVSTSVTPRQAIQLSLVLLPLIVWSSLIDFRIVPIWLIVALFLGNRVLRNYRQMSTAPSQSDTITAELEEMFSKIATSKHHIDHLVSQIRMKEAELSEKKEMDLLLDREIKEHTKEAQVLGSLTMEQRAALEGAVRRAQGGVSFGSIAAQWTVAISLNLAATVIWTLAGSPGRHQIVEHFEKVAERLTPTFIDHSSQPQREAGNNVASPSNAPFGEP